MDRETVMNWLEGLTEPDWRECYNDSEVQETARQALDLIDELLKEQEAETIECKMCGHRLKKDWNWCPWCRWETALREGR